MFRTHSILLVILCLTLVSIGCGGNAEPTQRVQLGPQLLDMAIDESWELEESTPADRTYSHTRMHDVRLSFSSETEDIGQPLQVAHVRSLIGKEMNGRYGGVSARVSFGGNAMIKYTRNEVDSDGESVRLEEWVLGKPFGYGGIARVSISLRIPASADGTPEIEALLETLDKQVGDATIPRA